MSFINVIKTIHLVRVYRLGLEVRDAGRGPPGRRKAVKGTCCGREGRTLVQEAVRKQQAGAGDKGKE